MTSDHPRLHSRSYGAYPSNLLNLNAVPCFRRKACTSVKEAFGEFWVGAGWWGTVSRLILHHVVAYVAEVFIR